MASDDFTNTNGTALNTHDSGWDDLGGGSSLSNLEINDNCVTVNGLEVGGAAKYTPSSEVLSEIVTVGGSSDTDSRFYIYVRSDATNAGYYAKIIGSATNWNYYVIYKDGSYYDEGSTANYARSSSHTFTFSALANGANRDLLLEVDSTTEYSTTDSSAPISRTGNPGLGIEAGAGAVESIITSWADGAEAGGVIIPTNPLFGPLGGPLRGQI